MTSDAAGMSLPTNSPPRKNARTLGAGGPKPLSRPILITESPMARPPEAVSLRAEPVLSVMPETPAVVLAERIEFSALSEEPLSDAADGSDAGRRKSDIQQQLSENRLSVRDLKKSFGKKKVVKGVGFYIKGGGIAGLLGPNGAGKTTIFYMIVGFYRPTEGNVFLNDVRITTSPMYRRARLGVAYLPQEASIFRKLTVEQNIQAVLEGRRDLTKAQKKERLDMLIEEFNIGRIRKQVGYTLSGGERRRTEIARALAIEPQFLLLDEPFAGIDPIAVYDIKQIIKKLAAQGIGILITDHNVRDTLEITNDALIISDGVIVARGTKELILNNQLVRDIYLGNDFQM